MMQQGKGKGKKLALPSPKEMVAHYEAKGMNQQEASLKVIEDLQNVLLRRLNAQNNTNLLAASLQSKLDSKPGYPQTLAISIASGAAFHALPHLARIWNLVVNNNQS